MDNPVVVSASVEGVVDEAVVRALLMSAGMKPGPVYGKQGKSHLQEKINGYNNAAQRLPWLVLVDLDRDYECAPQLRNAWLPQPASLLCFRVAVHSVEAWLLADAQRFASFLGVPRIKLSTEPEKLADPKTVVVNLARTSKRRAIREDMVPREGSGRLVGPAYSSRLIEFASSFWRPNIAARRADSLSRAIDCLKRLAQTK